MPRRAALRNTSIVSSAVGDSRSVSSIPRALAASACASTSESSQRVEGVSRGLGPVYWQWRRIASSSSGSSSRRRSRRATVSASAPSSKEIGDGDAEEDDDDEQQPSTSSSSGSPSPPDLATLRAKLDAAIEAEDYALAASLRDALRALEDDAVAGVTEANARFYAAFRAADIDVMASCLGFGENVTVIHPGCNAIRGREAVLESWRVIFSGATRAAGRGAAVALDIETVEVHVYAPALAAPDKGGSSSSSSGGGSSSPSGSEGSSSSSSSAAAAASPSKSSSSSSSGSKNSSNSSNGKGTGALGVVTCVERVDGGDSTGRVVATNVFERGGDGRYRMILHHGSSAPPLRRRA